MSHKTDPHQIRLPAKANKSYARVMHEGASLGHTMSMEDVHARWARRMRAARAWLDVTHDFRMMFGKALLGPIITMTGRESYQRNKKLMRAFIDSTTPTRLPRWVMVHIGEDRRLPGKDEYHYRVKQKINASKHRGYRK